MHATTTSTRTNEPVERGSSARRRLLQAVPLSERRIEVGGFDTAVLEGGSGSPIVLLHGPGESAAVWLRVAGELCETNRVVAPDLPGHGSTGPGDGGMEPAAVTGWLDELIDATCSGPPVLVGHVLGGAIAARFAVDRSDRLRHLVLVDALGLAPFRPAPRFALSLIGFQARPSARSYDRLMRQCSVDLERLRNEMGEQWEPFAEYNIELAGSKAAKHARRLMKRLGVPPIPGEHLARISVPTTLIWGEADRANRVAIAEQASERYGWPLTVIPDCADDPARDRPDAFLAALRNSLD